MASKRMWVAALLIALAAVVATGWVPAQAQAHQPATVIVPDSSVEHPGDAGVAAHTNHLILVRGKPQQTSGPSGETPGSLGCVYAIPGATGTSSGCTIASSTANAAGGSGVVAIVDAYDYPNAYNDLSTFSNQFGLPVLNNCTGSKITSNCFAVVYATKNGRKPAGNCGWNQEAALDIEWAHAMAPQANIVLVEAASNRLSDLLTAVNKASSIVQTVGSGQVSMSWGSGEFSSESAYDSYFNATGVAYFAASGDSGAQTLWPSVSPNVVSAGGTTVNRDSSGKFTDESAWSGGCSSGPCGAGGGPSLYESRPSYQDAISTLVGSSRGTPDFSFDANPQSGVSVYDSVSCNGMVGWMVFGGTSVSTPSLAGIVNLAGNKLGSGSSSSYSEQILLYTGYPKYTSTTFYDVVSGSTGYPTLGGWDFATGIGSDRGLSSK